MIATTTPIGEGSPVKEGAWMVCDVCAEKRALAIGPDVGPMPARHWVSVVKHGPLGVPEDTHHFCPSCWRVASERLAARKGANL